MERDKLSALRRALKTTYDLHPVGILAADENDRLIYKNRMAGALLHSARTGTRISRLFDVPQTGAGQITLTDGAREQLFALAYNRRPDGARLFCLFRAEGALREEFSELLLDYGQKLLDVTKKLADSPAEARGKRAYLDALLTHLEQAQGVTALLHATSGGIVDRHPGVCTPTHLGEFIEYFRRQTAPVLARFSMELSCEVESGLVGLFHFKDLFCGLLYLLDFFLGFVLSRDLHLRLVREADECVLTLSGEDSYRFAAFLSHHGAREPSRRQTERENALFYPLFCAMRLLHAHRFRVCAYSDEGHVRVEIRLPHTNELPGLVVRDDERALDELSRALVFPDTLLAHLRAQAHAQTAPIEHTPAPVTDSLLFGKP